MPTQIRFAKVALFVEHANFFLHCLLLRVLISLEYDIIHS